MGVVCEEGVVTFLIFFIFYYYYKSAAPVTTFDKAATQLPSLLIVPLL
jgi:hypothetical protein